MTALTIDRQYQLVVITNRSNQQLVTTAFIYKFYNPASDLASYQAQNHPGFFPYENDAEPYLREMRNAIQNCT